MPNQKILYLPIEVKNREFLSKCLVAMEAAKRGYTVIIGSRSSLFQKIKFLKKGIFFYMHATDEDFHDLNKITKNGFALYALDEEGPFIYDEDNHKTYRVSPRTFQLVKHFFCWGNKEREIIESKLGNQKDKISISGNPRFDLLRKEFHFSSIDETRELKDKYGEFILINTNFGRFNNFHGLDEYKEILNAQGKLKDPNDKKYYLDEIEYQRQVIPYFYELCKSLSQSFQNKNIVIRVHPSEKVETWMEVFQSFKNVHVTREGSVLKWLAACELLIHNNCTTAIEYFAMGKISISYRPILWPEHTDLLPNQVSVEYFSIEKLIKDISQQSLFKSFNEERAKNAIKAYVGSLEGKFSFDKIIDKFELDLLANPINSNALDIFRSNFFLSMNQKYYDMRLRLRKLLKGEIGLEYERNKFPSISIEEVKNILDNLSLPNEYQLNVKNYFKDLVIIKNTSKE